MALPVTITGFLVSTTNNDTVSKPFLSSAGNVYVFGKGVVGATNELRAFKATDPTSSFSSIGTDVVMTSTNNIQAVDAVQQGDLIHVVTTDAAAATAVDLRYHVFNMATDAWTIENETIVNDFAVVTLATSVHAAVNIRSDGDVIVLYNGQLVNIGAADRETVYYARREAGSWTADVEVSNAGSNSWFAGGIVIGSSDRMHFFFINDTLFDAHQRTLTSANALETFPASYDTSINTTQISVLATGASYVSGANTKVRYPQQDTGGTPLLSAKLDSADAPTVSTDSDITGTTDVESGAHRASFAVDNKTLWNTFVQNTTSDIFTQSNIDDGGWSTPESFIAVNSNGVRTNIYNRGGSVVLAMIYNTDSTTVYNEKVLATAAALDSDAVASVTWTGEEVSSGSVESGAFDSDAVASVTWNGVSTSASTLDSDAVASLTWNGISTAGSALDSDAVASLTWNGAATSGAAFDSDAAASLTWNGAATSGSAWSSTTAASLTWNGAATSASIFDSDASASLAWTGEEVGAAFTTADWEAAAVASLAMASASIVAADWNTTAVAELTMASATIAAASFDSSAVASLRLRGEAVGGVAGFDHVVMDGKRPNRRPIEDTEEEDIMFLMAAIHTYMEQDHGTY